MEASQHYNPQNRKPTIVAALLLCDHYIEYFLSFEQSQGHTNGSLMVCDRRTTGLTKGLSIINLKTYYKSDAMPCYIGQLLKYFR